MKKYTFDYFIEKFKAIPDNLWTVGILDNEEGSKCALGHCGGYVLFSIESRHLSLLLKPFYKKVINTYISDCRLNEVVFKINDDFTLFSGKTPKQRIINALIEAKKMANKSNTIIVEKIKYVAVNEGIRKTAKKLIEEKINS